MPPCLVAAHEIPNSDTNSGDTKFGGLHTHFPSEFGGHNSGDTIPISPRACGGVAAVWLRCGSPGTTTRAVPGMEPSCCDAPAPLSRGTGYGVPRLCDSFLHVLSGQRGHALLSCGVPVLPSTSRTPTISSVGVRGIPARVLLSGPSGPAPPRWSPGSHQEQNAAGCTQGKPRTWAYLRCPLDCRKR